MRQVGFCLEFVIVVLVGVLALQVGSVQAQDDPSPLKTLEIRVAALEDQIGALQGQVAKQQRQIAILKDKVDLHSADIQPLKDLSPLAAFVSVIEGEINGLRGPHVIFSKANVHVRSGSGGTEDGGVKPYGLGNLVVGYNEGADKDRTGSHNLIVGREHVYSSFGCLVAGHQNTASAPWSVLGGASNTASGPQCSVLGGFQNKASGNSSSVSGGSSNTASGNASSVSGGWKNSATGPSASVSGGATNTAGYFASSVLGGKYQMATGDYDTIP